MRQRLSQIGTVRHLAASSGPMFALSLLFFGFRMLRRLAAAGSDVVYSEELAPGEQLVITHSTDTR